MSYHLELAKQLASFLEWPLASSGGMMTLADVYCHHNRARRMEVCVCVCVCVWCAIVCVVANSCVHLTTYSLLVTCLNC